MLNNFILCLGGIGPIFILVALGFFLKKTNVIDDAFTEKANNLVFRVALPCMLFCDISAINLAEVFDTMLVGYAVAVVIIMFFASLLICRPLKSNASRAAFAQGIFRSNFAILGVPLAKALFPAEIAINAAVLLSVCVPIFNVLSVIMLTSLLQKEKGLSGALLGIVKNPLIIAAVLGCVFSVFKIDLPTLVMKPVSYLSQMCVPLSLIVIGASFVFSKARESFLPSFIASFIKAVVTPVLFVFPAYLLGIDGGRLAILYLFLATPAAVSSYTMTRNMGGDIHMAGNIVLISTAMSFFSIFFGILIMKNLGVF